MKKILLFLAVVTLCLPSCVKDKTDLGAPLRNELILDFPSSISLKFTEGTYRFDVKDYIVQTGTTDLSNLSFVWGYSPENIDRAAREITLGVIESETTYIEIEMDDVSTFSRFNNYYRLEVTDHLTNVTYHYNLTIKVQKPYEGAWMVLHEDGGTKVAGIEFREDGTNMISYDVMADAGNPALTGNPIALGYMGSVSYPRGIPLYAGMASAENFLFVVTDKREEAANYCPWKNFQNARCIYQCLQDQTYITDEKLSKLTYISGGAGYGQGHGQMAMVMDGELFQFDMSMRMYRAPSHQSGVGNDYYISHAHRMGEITMMYDNIGRRLLYYSHRNSDRIRPSLGDPETWDDEAENFNEIRNLDFESFETTVNPIPEDREVVFIGQSRYLSWDDVVNASSIIIALGVNGNDKSYAYLTSRGQEFFWSDESNVRNIVEFDTPADMNFQSCFASTYVYETYIYYSSGNKVYRFDYSTGSSRLLYEHLEGGTIEMMKFARDQFINVSTNYSAYQYARERSLGLVINRGGAGDFVLLELSEAGLLANDEDYTRAATQLFSGFGKIKDIVFL